MAKKKVKETKEIINTPEEILPEPDIKTDSKTTLQKHDIIIKDGVALGKYVGMKGNKMIVEYGHNKIEIEAVKIKKRVPDVGIVRAFV